MRLLLELRGGVEFRVPTAAQVVELPRRGKVPEPGRVGPARVAECLVQRGEVDLPALDLVVVDVSPGPGSDILMKMVVQMASLIPCACIIIPVYIYPMFVKEALSNEYMPCPKFRESTQ